MQALDKKQKNGLRHFDINGDPSAGLNWDNFFPFLVGRYSQVFSNFNYDKTGTAFPNGTGKKRDFNYNEFEFYAQDSWKARSDLTVTYGLRYLLHTVPYEINGFGSVPSINKDAYFSPRLAAPPQRAIGFGALPLL